MKLHGWCEKCHKIKRIRVTANALALFAVYRSVLQGVCDDCEKR